METVYCKCKKPKRGLGCNGDMIKDFCRRCGKQIKFKINKK